MKLALDWDSTTVEGVWPGRNGAWLPGSRETIRELLDSGWDIAIHTCRIAPVLSDGRERRQSAVDRDKHVIRRRLDKAGLGEVRIHDQPWKPNADVYLDDKALRFTTWEDVRAVLL